VNKEQKKSVSIVAFSPQNIIGFVAFFTWLSVRGIENQLDNSTNVTKIGPTENLITNNIQNIIDFVPNN
jgi:hypothetical protein